MRRLAFLIIVFVPASATVALASENGTYAALTPSARIIITVQGHRVNVAGGVGLKGSAAVCQRPAPGYGFRVGGWGVHNGHTITFSTRTQVEGYLATFELRGAIVGNKVTGSYTAKKMWTPSPSNDPNSLGTCVGTAHFTARK